MKVLFWCFETNIFFFFYTGLLSHSRVFQQPAVTQLFPPLKSKQILSIKLYFIPIKQRFEQLKCKCKKKTFCQSGFQQGTHQFVEDSFESHFPPAHLKNDSNLYMTVEAIAASEYPEVFYSSCLFFMWEFGTSKELRLIPKYLNMQG